MSVMITDLSQMLSERGVLPTPQRLAVFKALCGRCDHPGVDALFTELRKKLPTLSKTTVYAAMQLLAEKRLIGCVHGDGGEVRYDGETAFHAHFRCKACGRLYDIPAEDPHERPYVKAPKGFEVDAEELTYYGICPACKNRKTKTKKGK